MRARKIQDAIGEVLMQHWDPIGVNDVPEARGEYDAYRRLHWTSLSNSGRQPF